VQPRFTLYFISRLTLVAHIHHTRRLWYNLHLPRR